MTFSDLLNLGYFGFNFGMEDNWNSNILGLAFLGCAIIAYLLGSINCGVIISKDRYGKDIRESGSGNAGTTNMFRTYGKKAAALTFIGDVLKTAAAIIVGRVFLGYLGAFIAGFFCILGHAYPIFFKFKGGKGVVCISTMCLLTNPGVFLIMLGIFLIVLFGFKMVSLASVMIMVIYPFVLFNIGSKGPGLHVALGALCAWFIVYLHRENIKRIYNHKESTISFGKNKDKKGKKSYKDED